MKASVVYKPERTPNGRFRAEGEIIVYVDGKYRIQEFTDPDQSLTFVTESEVEARIWQLATSWRKTEMPSADLIDDKGRCSRGSA